MSNNVEIEFSSSVLNLENLEMEFNLLMKQYEQAKLNYLSDLNSPSPKPIEIFKDKKLMDRLNKKLIIVSHKIQKELKNNKPVTSEENKELEEQHQNLVNSYAILIAERERIDNILKDYYYLDQEYEDNMLQLNSNNSRYLLWFALATVVITYLIKTLVFPDLELNIFRMFFWLILFFLFVISTFHLNQSSGFLIWLLIIVFFIFINAKIIPSP